MKHWEEIKLNMADVRVINFKRSNSDTPVISIYKTKNGHATIEKGCDRVGEAGVTNTAGAVAVFEEALAWLTQSFTDISSPVYQVALDAARYRHLRDSDAWGDDGDATLASWSELGEATNAAFDKIVDDRIAAQEIFWAADSITDKG